MSKPIRNTVAWFLLLLVAACAPAGPITVTLQADGATRPVATDAQTVGDLLAQQGLTLDEDDRVTPPENTFLSDGATVRVIRVEVRMETEQQVIPYGREIVRDATVPVGQTHLLRAGVNGLLETTFAVTLEDGVQVDRRVVRQVNAQEPQNEVLLIGALEEVIAVPISGTIAYLSAHNAWVVRTSTGNSRRLTSTGDLDGRVFDLSPDGARLLFTRTATETGALNELWLMDTVTADAEPVRLAAQNILWAGFAPDGENIAYSTCTVRDAAPGWQATNDLYIAAPRMEDGLLRGRRQVLGPSAGGTYGWWGTTFAWVPTAPEGEIAPVLAYARADEVGVVRTYNGQVTPLSSFPPYHTRGPWAWAPPVSWSPEGAFIATVVHGPPSSGETPEDSPVFDLYVLGIAVDERGVVTPTIAVELASEVGMWTAPAFSPDGSWIAFGRARIPYTSQTSAYDLYVMDRDGSDRRLLFPPDPGDPGLDFVALAWDPWGGQLTLVYQGDLYLLTTEGLSRRITDDGAIDGVRWAGTP